MPTLKANMIRGENRRYLLIFQPKEIGLKVKRVQLKEERQVLKRLKNKRQRCDEKYLLWPEVQLLRLIKFASKVFISKGLRKMICTFSCEMSNF